MVSVGLTMFTRRTHNVVPLLDVMLKGVTARYVQFAMLFVYIRVVSITQWSHMLNISFVEGQWLGYENIREPIQFSGQNRCQWECSWHGSKHETIAGPVPSFKTSLKRHLSPHVVRFHTSLDVRTVLHAPLIHTIRLNFLHSTSTIWSDLHFEYHQFSALFIRQIDPPHNTVQNVGTLFLNTHVCGTVISVAYIKFRKVSKSKIKSTSYHREPTPSTYILPRLTHTFSIHRHMHAHWADCKKECVGLDDRNYSVMSILYPHTFTLFAYLIFSFLPHSPTKRANLCIRTFS